MQIKLKPSIVVTKDTAGKFKHFNTEDASLENVITDYLHQVSGSLKVTAATLVTIDLSPEIATCKGLWMEVTKACTVTINGASFTMAPVGTRTVAHVLLEATITTLTITGGAEDVDVDYVLWGDASA